MRILLALALAASVFVPACARADTTATLSNVLLVEQLVDSVQTTSLMRERRCLTIVDEQLHIDQIGCEPGAHEVDPFATPFVHSLPLSIAAAGLVNAILRPIARHDLVGRYVLGAAVLLYPMLLEHNARSVRASITVHF